MDRASRHHRVLGVQKRRPVSRTILRQGRSLVGSREFDDEPGAARLGVLGTDVAPVARHQRVDQGEPAAGAVLSGAEHRLLQVVRDPRTVVRDGESDRLGSDRHRDLDVRVGGVVVLDGVLEEVVDDRPDAVVGGHNRRLGEVGPDGRRERIVDPSGHFRDHGHDVDRFVQLSALGADPEGPTAYIRAKGRAEKLVRESGLDWTVVRPSVVFGDGGEFVGFTRLLTTPYVTGLPGGGKTRFQPIWVRDLAPMLADALEEDEHVGQTYEVGGPETLSLREATELVFEAEGKSISIVPLPMPLAKIGLPVLGSLGFPMGSDQYEGLDFDNTPTTNDAEVFGRDPASLRSFR